MFGRETAGGWTLTENRFLNAKEVEALRACARQRVKASGWLRRSKVLEWITVEIALNTGLRVSEIAQLCCGDIWMGPVVRDYPS
jgi:integrase